MWSCNLSAVEVVWPLFFFTHASSKLFFFFFFLQVLIGMVQVLRLSGSTAIGGKCFTRSWGPQNIPRASVDFMVFFVLHALYPAYVLSLF